jgi:tetratricopeptide (TPR) repeat protein
MSHSPALSRLTLKLAARCALAAALLAAACAAASAQGSGSDMTGNGGKHSIRGRIYFPSGRRSDAGLKVKLVSTGFGDVTILSDTNGSFSFMSLRPGSYSVVIEGGDDYETVRESVFIESDSSLMRGAGIPSVARPYTVQIYLQPKAARRPAAQPGVLNAALANVPKPAVELYHKGMEAARKNENERAVDLLKLAVETHPNFPVALSELGVLYLKLKRPERAAEALAASLKLAPEDHGTLLAYGRALFDLKRPAEAEEQFRRALKKNPSSAWARFYIGMILLGRHEYEEAERELKAATETGDGEIAMAHYYLGGLYWELKQYKRAADELETYLKLAPSARDAERLRTTIKELRAK